MKAKRVVFAGSLVILALAISFLLMTVFVSATTVPVPSRHIKPDARSISGVRATESMSVTFPQGDWPWYAQEEITVHPDPPLPGSPVKLCAIVVNQDLTQVHIATLEFRVANFGIGVPFTPVGTVEVAVPPGGNARGCVVWVPPEPGHWCIEVALLQPDGSEPERSQRNIDIWEPLVPGESHTLSFPVGPLTNGGRITFTHHNLLGWDVAINPQSVSLAAGETKMVSLTTFVPQNTVLGTFEPIVDVEGYLLGELIGGFRKVDTPPVVLHHPQEPFFAESEIDVWPYPPRAGEPTQICVEVYNLSDLPQIVAVQFSVANFGIGLPFHPIHTPIEVEVPAHSHKTVCINWIPPNEGHFCVQVEMNILGNIPYYAQFSQRNLDVTEVLKPGVPHTMRFRVGNFSQFTNPDPVPTTIWLEADVYLPGWEVVLEPRVLQEVAPETTRWVTLTVMPPQGEPLPEDGTPIVDVRALIEGREGFIVIGGFRKIFRPPVPLHRFPDPSYAEREISVYPYPPRAGEPVEVCVELYNPTDVPQEVNVTFSWAHFGIGIPFTPIDGPHVVIIPPHTTVKECIHWVPKVSGHVCLQVVLEMEGYLPQRSQRNIDVDEPLVLGQPHTLSFPVGNPFEHVVDIELGAISHLPGWEIQLEPRILSEVPPGERRVVSLTVVPPAGAALPADGESIVDVEAYAPNEAGEMVLIGGFRKIHRPSIPLHPFPDPPYAEREITLDPYPPRAGEPTEVCVELRNPTAVPQDVEIQFSWANFGVGLPWQQINGLRLVHLPAHGVVKECIHWIPPVSGHLCLQVDLFIPNYEPQRSQRNIDVDEPLYPNIPHNRAFLVGNPYNRSMTITLGLVPHLPDWRFELAPNVLPDMKGGEVREVVLTVIPPDELPDDGQAVVDVEAYDDAGALIGGFRKIFRPTVPIHRPKDPVYAESEIFIHPYPLREREPTEVGVEIRNPTDKVQTITVTFSAADFGIGLPFDPIHEPLVVRVPSNGLVRPTIMWIPPHGGLWCIQVEIELPGHRRVFWSRRNIDVGEPLEPLTPHSRIFPVGNPYTSPATITLGLVPYFSDWVLELSQDVLPDVQPGEVRPVTLTVTPPEDLPEDGASIVDVEAFVDGALLGGFRKIFRPPVPVHLPKDPVYAESEIGVDPYPVIAGQPVKLSVEVFNPTHSDRVVTATFRIARFGIGLPFTTSHIIPNPIRIFVPANGAARGHVIWRPPAWAGKFCVEVILEMPNHEKVWSRRNIDVGEPLRRGEPHTLVFPVGAWPYTYPVSITLGLIQHREGWDISLSQDELYNVVPGQPVEISLTVTPSLHARLGTGDPIVDVEAFVDGELLGGFRKLDIPPIPIHKPHEKMYAETELSLDPDPPKLGQPAKISAVIQNNGTTTDTVFVEFGWSKFGMGIIFTSTGIVSPVQSLTLAPALTATAAVSWTPLSTGHYCVQVKLIDPDDDYEEMISQRNVDIIERPPCGQTRIFTFTVYNDSPFTVTVDLGMITFNVPEDWEVTTEPTGTLELGRFSEGVVKVIVTIPCPAQGMRAAARYIEQLQQEAGSVPTIDVEGYISGTLVGGIELQFVEREPETAGVVLSPGTTQTARPGDIVTYTHILTNAGTTTDTFALDTVSSQGWNVMLSAQYQGQSVTPPLEMMSGMTATVRIAVHIPTGVVSGTMDTTILTATSQMSATVFATAQDHTYVETEVISGEAGLALSPGEARTTQPDTVLHYTHLLTNTGTTTDTVILTAHSDHWEVTLAALYNNQTIILPAFQMKSGATATLTATLTVPTSAISGTVDMTTITVTSQLSPTLFVTAVNTTTIVTTGEEKFMIYLPVVLRGG
ncbi:MAG: hypothetical protein JXA33_05375 [Anaerolineae bacterium]|nr:hypothetical protein [Anaerolineae bacterium]